MWSIVTDNIEDEEGPDMVFTVGSDYEYLEAIMVALGDLRPNMKIDIVEFDGTGGFDTWPDAEFEETWQLVS